MQFKKAVEKLGARMAETRIAILEDKDQSWDVTVETATKTIAQLQEKIMYLEDAGCHNNVHIAEGQVSQMCQFFFLWVLHSVDRAGRPP